MGRSMTTLDKIVYSVMITKPQVVVTTIGAGMSTVSLPNECALGQKYIVRADHEEILVYDYGWNMTLQKGQEQTFLCIPATEEHRKTHGRKTQWVPVPSAIATEAMLAEKRAEANAKLAEDLNAGMLSLDLHERGIRLDAETTLLLPPPEHAGQILRVQPDKDFKDVVSPEYRYLGTIEHGQVGTFEVRGSNELMPLLQWIWSKTETLDRDHEERLRERLNEKLAEFE